MALSSEEIERNSMYPNLVRTATLEEFPAGNEQFGRMHAIEERHVELIEQALGKEGRLPRAEYYVCPTCGYILTSARTEECPVDQTVKASFLEFR
jgi:rubrerythrin